MILLTDEEVMGLSTWATTEDLIEDVARAQLKKVVEWGNEPCLEHEHGRRIDKVPRKACSECWQAIQGDIK